MKKIIIITAIWFVALLQVSGQNSFTGESGIFAMDTKNPEVTLDAPNGGGTYNYYLPLDISWAATDHSFGDTPIAAGLSTEEGGEVSWLAQDLANSGSTQMELPHQETAFAKAHIKATDNYGNQATGASNTYFSLLQGIYIPQGWSIISSWQQPDNPAMDEIFSELNAQNKVTIMLGKSGIYWPAHNINTLGDWDVYEGYKIRMGDDGGVLMTGQIPDNKTIDAQQGINYLPVLCDVPVLATEIFDQFGDDLHFAFDIYAGLIYWPEGGIYTLDTLMPGSGYLVSLLQPRTATYNCGKASGGGNWAKAQPQVYENAPWGIHKTGTAHFVAVAASATSQLQPGDFMGAFNSAGQCMGMSQYNGDSKNMLLVAYADDQTTQAKDGFAEDEPMYFKVYAQATGQTSIVNVNWDPSMPNTNSFAANGRSGILKFSTGALAIDKLMMENIQIHPNPNKGMFDIQIPNCPGELTIEITNASGMTIHTEKLNTAQSNISHPINLSHVPAGIYFVRISNGNSIAMKKVVIQ